MTDDDIVGDLAISWRGHTIRVDTRKVPFWSYYETMVFAGDGPEDIDTDEQRTPVRSEAVFNHQQTITAVRAYLDNVSTAIEALLELADLPGQPVTTQMALRCGARLIEQYGIGGML